MRPDRKLSVALACACAVSTVHAFVPNLSSGRAGALRPRRVEPCGSVSGLVAAHDSSSFVGTPVLTARPTSGPRRTGKAARRERNARGRSMGMLLDGTVLGIGTPEVLVILAVGYFVLGPVELFKVTKQAGVLFGQVKDIGLGTATNLSSILDDTMADIEKTQSGENRKGFDPNQEYPQGEEDEFEEVTLDEFGRIVIDGVERPPPATEETPLFEGWSGEGLGLNGENGPLEGASKFAKQMSGAVNQKIMDLSDSLPGGGADTNAGADLWGEVETAAAATAKVAGGVAGAGMANQWKPPTNEVGMDQELANDVPAELSMDEQFERLDTIAALEEERATLMQRLESKIEAKVGSIKNELLEIVDEDFQEKRARVNQEFLAKSKAKAAAADAAVEPKTIDRETTTAGVVRGEDQ